MESAVPSFAHMALVALQRHMAAEGRTVYLSSGNTDGLHRRSGFPGDALSELHGNTNAEWCPKCERTFLRDFPCRDMRNGVFEHATGRVCPSCSSMLQDSIVNFGENLPEVPLSRAFEHSDKADVHIVLGSSLTVSPSNDCPRKTKKRGGKVVICNLQRTPLDSLADIRVHGKTDDLMKLVMEHLNIPVSSWLLNRFLRIRTTAADPAQPSRVTVTLDSVEPDGLPASVIQTAQLVECKSAANAAAGPVSGGASPVLLTSEPFSLVVDAGSVVCALCGWYMHYQEPPLVVQHRADAPGTERRLHIAYSVHTRSWQTLSDTTTAAAAAS